MVTNFASQPLVTAVTAKTWTQTLGEESQVPWYRSVPDFDAGTIEVAALEAVEVRQMLKLTPRQRCLNLL